MTNQAQAAKTIKTELKAAFPTVKFSVKSDSFAGGDSVRVSYEDGPKIDDVREIADKYMKGSFDGMNDLYSYDNKRDDIPQTKYVTYSRTQSDETRSGLRAFICDQFGIDEDVSQWDSRPELDGADIGQKSHRVFCQMDLTGDISQAEFEAKAAAAL